MGRRCLPFREGSPRDSYFLLAVLSPSPRIQTLYLALSISQLSVPSTLVALSFFLPSISLCNSSHSGSLRLCLLYSLCSLRSHSHSVSSLRSLYLTPTMPLWHLALRLHVANALAVASHCPTPQSNYLSLCSSTSHRCRDGLCPRNLSFYTNLSTNHEGTMRSCVVAPQLWPKHQTASPISVHDILSWLEGLSL